MQADSGLDAYLAKEILLPITRKHWFSQEYVRLGDYLRRAQGLFEVGVVLGFGFRERLSVLSEMLAPSLVQGIRTSAAPGLSSADKVSPAQSERCDFLELFFKPEAESWINYLRENGRTRKSGWRDLPKLDRKKMAVPEILAGLRLAFRKGIDLGGGHPQLAESLFTAFPNPETWSSFRGRSELPAIPPAPKPFDTREFDAKSLILPYIEEQRPDNLARLGLWPSAGSDVRLRMRALRARMNPRPTTHP